MVLVAFSLGLGGSASALTLDSEGNYQLGGYISNMTAIRLEDAVPGGRPFFGDTVHEAGDLSMFRNELFLDFSANVADNFQFKVIMRAHYEGVWGLDSDVDQTPKDNKMVPGPDALDMESDVDFREYYMTYTNGNLVVKLGRQQVAWGEADAINIADVICPLDLSWRWSFPNWEDIRIPLHMLNASYSVPNSAHDLRFELVYIPADFRPHNFGYPGSNWALYTSGLGNPNFVGESFFDKYDEGLPDDDLSNPQGGIRVHAMLGEWDTNWFVYYGRDKTSVQTLDLSAIGVDAIPLFFHYPHRTLLGVTFNYYWNFIKAVLRGEAVYTIDQPFTPLSTVPGSTAPVSPFELEEADTIEVMIGFDYNAMIPFLNRTKSFFFSGQIDNKYIFDIDENNYRTFFGHNDAKDHRLIMSLLINTEYYEGKIVPQVLGVTFVNEESGFFDANITYKPTFTLNFMLGYLNIWGNGNQAGLFFGPIKNNDEVYARVKWTF
jgi:Protein of unknown function (DUF1302)